MKRLSIILIFIIITISTVTFSATQLPGGTKSFGFIGSDSSETAGTENESSAEKSLPNNFIGSTHSISETTGEKKNLSQPYFTDSLSLKILLVLIFSTGAIIIAWKRKFKYRKPFLITSTVILGFLMGGFLCPSLTIQNAIYRYETAYLILFLIPLVITFVFGRVYCGYVCPYGAIQELINVKNIKIPKKVDRYLKYIKYVLLVTLPVISIIVGYEFGFEAPFKTVFNFSFLLVPLIITIGFAFISIFSNRFFCRYICPYGALMGLISKISIFRLFKDEDCIKCGLCVKACPQGAMCSPGESKSECIVCGKCIEKCPKDCLKIKGGKK
jgi:polyferredoxin